MEAVSASPVTALMNDVSRQHEKRKEDFDPDPEWIKALQVRINDEKKTMRTQARKDFEAKLGEVDPIDQAAEERLEAEYSASLAAIDRLLIQEYEREVATERAQRMILAGLEDDPAVKAVIEQQAAILAAIQKGDKQGDASLESTASLSRGRAPIDIDAAGPSTEYNPTRRSRPSQASIRNNRGEIRLRCLTPILTYMPFMLR
ncbi:hypothetical protein OE88DRAFT_766420 [Heliocybe sulcata]|uniref:Uncharacterized protein n=1 Tax=Heliocybe sulcata TaxID=5364 RepID=A0A5C3N1D2_9AGAM|nr:hypothetical protein OE88DRAFT_766420 [Heliocybe sulcata]